MFPVNHSEQHFFTMVKEFSIRQMDSLSNQLHITCQISGSIVIHLNEDDNLASDFDCISKWPHSWFYKTADSIFAGFWYSLTRKIEKYIKYYIWGFCGRWTWKLKRSITLQNHAQMLWFSTGEFLQWQLRLQRQVAHFKAIWNISVSYSVLINF